MSGTTVLALRNYTLCTDSEDKWSPTYAAFNQILGCATVFVVIFGVLFNINAIRNIHLSNFDKNRGVVLAVSILALAVWDTILLGSAFFYYGVKGAFKLHRNNGINLITPFFHGCLQVANTASTWCVIFITIQRYMATRDPFRTTRHSRIIAQSFRGERRKTSFSLIYCFVYRRYFKVPLIISIVAILVNLTAFFEITTKICLRMPEGKMGYMLAITWLRLNHTYKLVYKLIFRMIVTSCGPNIFIFTITGITIFFLKGSNRNRRQLFQMSDSLLDRYSSKETTQTTISILLVTKFLLLRSLSFFLDLMELISGFGNLHDYIYAMDVSNFCVILNSATNSLIFMCANSWLQNKLTARNTMKRRKQLCIESLQSLHRVNLLFKSYKKALFMTNHQLGVRVLYSMLIKSPSLAVFFNQSTEVGSDTPPPPAGPPPTPAAYDGKTPNATRFRHFVKAETVEEESSDSELCHVSPVIMVPNVNGHIRSSCPITGSENAGHGCPGAVNARTAEVVAAMPHIKKRSLDLLGNSAFHTIGDRIMTFMGELIDAMRMAKPDHDIIMRIRNTGAHHHKLGITFTSSAWKEFKASTISIIEECEFANEIERKETLDAWNSFLSVIIREMKMGICGVTSINHTNSYHNAAASIISG
uniref:G_PROTEIN_RECEP_F1_2 domain-containing protein n=1 Tax=Panagrellus redivivus TaxID=6233 RepID=A0A7E4VJ73_PANRE